MPGKHLGKRWTIRLNWLVADMRDHGGVMVMLVM